MKVTVLDPFTLDATIEGELKPGSEAKLILDGKEYELPVIVGSEGEVGIDIRKLRKASGAVTFDSGYGNTGSCQSEITFIDGEQGIMRYRGYPIEEVAEACSFTEVCFLLIHGRLPTQDELDAFNHNLSRHTLLHEDMKKFFEGYAPSAHPMAILSSMVASLSTYYHASEGDGATDLNIIRLLAKVDRPAFHLSAERSLVHTELPTHDVRDARRAVRGAASSGRCTATPFDTSCRPRAELLDVDGTDGGLERGESVCRNLGRHQRAVWATSRRGKPARHRDVGADPRRR